MLDRWRKVSVIASEAKQSIEVRRGCMDCFAAPAMTKARGVHDAEIARLHNAVNLQHSG